MTITTFLSERLSELDATALVDLGVFAGVDIKTARRAASGEPIAAWAALSLLAAVGYDPMTLKRRAPQRVGKFNHNALALFMVTRIRTQKLTMRHVGYDMRVSTRVVNAICEGRPVNAANVIKACAYLDIDPLAQCERVREAA